MTLQHQDQVNLSGTERPTQACKIIVIMRDNSLRCGRPGNSVKYHATKNEDVERGEVRLHLARDLPITGLLRKQALYPPAIASFVSLPLLLSSQPRRIKLCPLFKKIN